MAVYKDKKTKTWFVKRSWYDAHKKRHYITRRGFKTKREAEKVNVKLAAQVNDGIDVTRDPVFADYYNEWVKTYKENSVAPNTLRQYILASTHLQHYFGQTTIKSINRSKYQQFINWFGKNHAKSTVVKTNRFYKSCVSSAIEDGIITRNFTDHITLAYNNDKAFKVTYLQADDITRLFNYLYDYRRPQYTTSYMLMLMIVTGLRESEVAGLTWNNIYFSENLIKVEKSWVYSQKDYGPTKNETSQRIVSVPQIMMDCIKELKGNHKAKVFWYPSYKIFPGHKSLGAGLQIALKNLNISAPGFHPHSLRHSQVALLLQANIPIYDIAKRLGHSTTRTTEQTYAYEFKKHRDLMNQKINDALDKSLKK